MAPAVIARSLHKRFEIKGSEQAVHALAGVSLEVPAGTLTALVGPDGAGKTTLLRLMAGLLRADEGTLRVLGIDVAADPQAVQDRISYMPQRFGLYEDLSVQENLDLYADLHGVPRQARRERQARLMEMTDLGRFTDRPAGKLSGGMKQKLGLACTLVRSPDLLLLDEPTVGVDPLSRRELWQIVQQLVDEEKLSVIVSTAYLDEAERCSQVFVLREGRLIAGGTPDEIRDHAEGLCFAAAPPPGEAPRLLQARLLDARETVIDAVPQGGEVHVICRRGADHALADLLGGARAEPVPPRLEDGFMVLLRTQQADDATPIEAAPPPPVAAGASPAETVIEVKDLVRRFGDFTAVASTSFSVRRGEIFGLLGPNGAGKTTTFRMLCGLLPASGGQLRVAGVDLRHARAEARRRIGYVSQKFALYGNLTVHENLSFFGGAYGLRGPRLRERMATVLRQFDLERERDAPSGQLPGGYKQRLAMATGLLHEPEILFLDEPTSGADPLARRAFWRRITALAEGGTTIVITTHFMEEAEYCDRIVIQDAGKVLAIGTPREVRAQALEGDATSRRIGMEQAFIDIVENARRANDDRRAAA
ncbi:ABC-2 type transport system ATP-binding protein [Variovorax sp. TBS-050B]|uniref:ATP-binding cassette domain-containing protein n=1 Tax=Variovorax sp. TBS-050B TaxID=2940551 RepID=UPI0024732D78|nr:ATP-binding cassette domain-containing protein [Variovorax sp. TBS-050B]MDH6595160.1 ABC-2 type transport system ATP-binding protein [Variovorax sp. TBS-050B]